MSVFMMHQALLCQLAVREVVGRRRVLRLRSMLQTLRELLGQMGADQVVAHLDGLRGNVRLQR
jgi:hypothetical protein